MLRVVAGKLRGRCMHTVTGRAAAMIRPTTDRAREGAFNWLGPLVEGAQVLELFAGTGALGIEALSRGAGFVTFLESSRPALAVLRRNLEELSLIGCTRVRAGDVRTELSRERSRFDLILADPPYGPAGGKGKESWIAWLLRQGRLEHLLERPGVLLVERPHAAEAIDPPAWLRLRGSRKYGGTVFDWYDTKEGDPQ